MAKNAVSQITHFNRLCEQLIVLPLSDAVVIRAASIYGQLWQAGQIIGDADILIAATCLQHGCSLATNNTYHFARIEGLMIRNWTSD